MDNENTLKGEFILKDTTPIHKQVEKTHREKPHFYTAFSDHPEGVTFAEQERDEEVVLLLRRHFVTNVPWIALILFLALLPATLPFVAATFPLPNLSLITITLLFAFYYLILFGIGLLNFALWYFHVGLVTTLRLIDIDLAGLLYRQVTTTRHENVEDVTYSQTGFISSLFNYGNVHIQTAGTQENVEFDRVPRPSRVADVISDLVNPV